MVIRGVSINRWMTTLTEEIKDDVQRRRDKFRTAIYQYLLQYSDLLTHAVTLTFDGDALTRLKMKSPEMKAEVFEEIVQRSFKHFVTRLNRSVYGNAAQRYGKTLLILPVIEGLQRGQCPHYHCAIAAPLRVSDAQLLESVTECWKSVAFAGHQVDVQPYRSERWLGYMSKKAVFLDRTSVDWSNVQLPAHLLAHC